MKAAPFRIFISSPGDVAAERRRAALVVSRLKREFARFFDLQPVLWEYEPMLASGNFQEIIEPPSTTDIVVLILWSRLGHALPAEKYQGIDGRTPVTGTEWEFEDALCANREHGVPALLVYRKTAEAITTFRRAEDLNQARTQWAALEEFWRRYFVHPDGSFKAAFSTFEDLEEFESSLETHLRHLIRERSPAHAAPGAAPTRVTWQAGSPFRGLKAFDVEHAPIFFGRTKEQKEVAETLARRAAQGTTFVLVLGASGSGKSSLVRAGVLPDLMTPGVVAGVDHWCWCVFRPSDAPTDLRAGMARAILEQALPDLPRSGVGLEELIAQFQGTPAQAMLPLRIGLQQRQRDPRGAAAAPTARLIVVADQLEELFTHGEITAEAREAFAGLLAALAKSGLVWVIGTIRSDFYHRVAEVPALFDLSVGKGQYHLGPPRAGEIEQMIRLPAEAAGLAFEVDPESGIGLDAELRDAAVRDPGALPLLEFALDQLYQEDVAERHGTVLRLETYRTLGGLAGAIASRAEQVCAALPREVEAELPGILRALVSIDPANELVTARTTPRAEIEHTPERARLIDTLIAARLLTSSDEGEGAVLRWAHEALFSAWPRARAILAADRAFLLWRQRLEAACAEWEHTGHDPDSLLRGAALAEAERWQIARRAELTAEEQGFLDASLRQREERARRTSRQRRRRQQAMVTVTALVLALGLLATWQGWQAQRQAARARASAIVTAASSALTRGDPLEGALLLAELNGDSEPRGGAALASELAQSALPLAALVGHGNIVTGVAFSPDSRHVVTTSADQTARVWRTDGTGRPVVLAGHEGPLSSAAFSPDGAWIATAAADHTARLWRADGTREPVVLRGHTGVVWSVAFSPDGRHVATASGDETARLWPADGAGAPRVLGGHEGPVWSVVFDPAGARVATASADQTARVWSVDGTMPPVVLRGHGGDVRGVAFSPDGARVATASRDGTVRVWPADGGGAGTVLRGHEGEVYGVAFSPDGTRVATASRDGTARVWPADGGGPALVLDEHTGDVWSVALSPDGRTLLTASSDGTARLWHLDGGGAVVLRGHRGWVTSAAFSADGTRVVTGSWDDTARVWRADGTDERLRLHGHEGEVYAARFSPDGARVGTVSGDGTVRLWHADGAGTPTVLAGHAGEVRRLAFSADGRRVATASRDGTAHVWPTDGAGDAVVLRGHTDWVMDVALSADGARVVTGSRDGTARVWRADGRGEPVVLDGHGGAVMSVAMTPDGTSVATASRDGTARVWRADGAAAATVLTGHADEVRSVAFSPDGARVATASLDDTARIWRADGAAAPLVLRGHAGDVWSATFSRDGTRVVTASRDATARVWRADRAADPIVLQGHEGWVTSATFSPDGTRVVTTSLDDSARVWRADGQGDPVVLHGHQGVVWDAGFSPDGEEVVTASEDGTARVWRVGFARLIAYLRAATSACLTAEQRGRLLGEPDGDAARAAESCAQGFGR